MPIFKKLREIIYKQLKASFMHFIVLEIIFSVLGTIALGCFKHCSLQTFLKPFSKLLYFKLVVKDSNNAIGAHLETLGRLVTFAGSFELFRTPLKIRLDVRNAFNIGPNDSERLQVQMVDGSI